MSISNWLKRLFGTFDQPSPSDIIKEEGIKATDNNIVIDLTKLNIPFTKPPRLWITTVQDTNSMDPTVDYLHTCLLIQGIDETDQKIMINFITVGNIVVAKNVVAKTNDEYFLLHRVYKIGQDNGERFFILKGDNNYKDDGVKLRDIQIHWLLVGIIY